MKIISWNCRGKFREKHAVLEKMDAAIYAIQECENPEKHKTQFASFSQNYLWTGENDNRGLGIFAKPEINIQKNNWDAYCLRHFISVRVNNDFDLLGVWAGPPYIEEYYIYQSINIKHYNKNTLIIGDFNSNARWDKAGQKRNHTAVVKELQEIGLVSAYHHMSGERHGEETEYTFFMYKHPNKKYHIDYCFAAPERIRNFSISDPPEWLNYSDHAPIEIIL